MSRFTTQLTWCRKTRVDATAGFNESAVSSLVLHAARPTTSLVIEQEYLRCIELRSFDVVDMRTCEPYQVYHYTT